MKILLVEDDESIRALTNFILEKENYQVTIAETGEKGLELIEETIPDLILLDIVLPGINGFEVCKRLKKDPRTSKIPIIMLSQLGSEEEVSAGLEKYADDYITKPFKPKILLARIASVMRRYSTSSKKSKVIVGPIVIDDEMKEITVDGDKIQFRAAEYDILLFLAKSPNKTFSRQDIIEGIKGEDYLMSERVIDNYIYLIRKTLGSAGKLIETVSGFGYRIRN